MAGGLPTFPLGVGPPVVYGVVVDSFVGGIDFTTATGVTLFVQKPDRSTVRWTGSLAAAPGDSAITPTRVLVEYPFQTPDLDQTGTWAAQFLFALPGGEWPNDPDFTPRFKVTDQWGNPST